MKSIVNRENHFVTYLAYGWGIPAALTSVLLILQNSSMTERYKPGIGDTSCWFSGKNFEIRNNTKFFTTQNLYAHRKHPKLVLY